MTRRGARAQGDKAPTEEEAEFDDGLAPASEANHDAVESGETAPFSLSGCDSQHAEHEHVSLTSAETGKTIGSDAEDRTACNEGSDPVSKGVQVSGNVALVSETFVPSPATSRDARGAAAASAGPATLGGVRQQMLLAPSVAAESDEDEAGQVRERGEAAEVSITEDKEEDADDSSVEGGEDAATVGLGDRKASNSNFRALLEADAARAKEMKQVCDLRFAVQLLYMT